MTTEQPGKHLVELLPLQGDPQADCNLLRQFLDHADANDFECITVLPLQLGQLSLAGGIIKQGQRQAAFCVVLRRKTGVCNGQALLDDRQAA